MKIQVVRLWPFRRTLSMLKPPSIISPETINGA